jgi:1,4-dihydroxy-2-naphthoate polyprenyltransferase
MKKWEIWLSAVRPQTLAAAFVPVITGASLAWLHNSFHALASVVALFCALFIQIGTNFANDYFDFKKGADTKDRLGFTRATSAGLIQPETMLQATFLTMGIAFLAGMYLVWVGGWVILSIGILSIIFGILYTGGPFPLGYNGLGDIFVFLFFGFAAVMGTYYVNTLEWSTESFLISIPIGALSVNILVVNNLRDIEQDRNSGKRTLGVLFGEAILKIEYLAMILLAYISLIGLYIIFDYNLMIFLPILGLPAALTQLNTVWTHKKKSTLNHTLERTAQFMILFGILLSVSILLQTS